MNYTSVSRMLTVLPSVGSVTTLTSADIAAFGDDAEALVNAKIGKLYTVPVSPTPPLLTTLATDIALYRLLALRIFTSEQINNSAWPDRFKDAMKLLDDVADGKISLVTSSGTLVSATVAVGLIVSDIDLYKPTMDEREPFEQRVDLNKLDDLAS